MSEYIQGAYNIHEHNHTEWSDERLHAEVLHLTEQQRLVKYVGERATQMAFRTNLVMQEQLWRYAETHGANYE